MVVEPRNPFMPPRSRRSINNQGTEKKEPSIEQSRPNLSRRPRHGFPKAPEKPGVPEIVHEHHEHEDHKHGHQESFLEAFIKLINSLMRFKGK